MGLGTGGLCRGNDHFAGVGNMVCVVQFPLALGDYHTIREGLVPRISLHGCHASPVAGPLALLQHPNTGRRSPLTHGGRVSRRLGSPGPVREYWLALQGSNL